MKRPILIAATLGFLALAPARASAGLLVLNYSGTFSADTTLGGTPLGADTPFTLAATFDPTANQTPGGGGGRFAATLHFDIAGFGTFDSAPGAGVRLQLTDPTSNGVNSYQLGLLDALGSEIDPLYSIASPPFTGNNPVPSVLTGYLGTLYVGFFTTIPLAGNAGDLVVPNGGILSFGPTATITSAAVPEPASVTLLGIAALGYVGLTSSRRPERIGTGRRGDPL